MTTIPLSWGDTVRVSQVAPDVYRPGALAEVVGLRMVPRAGEAESEQAGEKRIMNLVLIEFADGSSVELPDYLLERTSEE